MEIITSKKFKHPNKTWEKAIHLLLNYLQPTEENPVTLITIPLSAADSCSYVVKMDFPIALPDWVQDMPEILAEWEDTMIGVTDKYIYEYSSDITPRELIILILIKPDTNHIPGIGPILKTDFPHQKQGNIEVIYEFIKEVKDELHEIGPESRQELENIKYGFQRLIESVEADIKIYEEIKPSK